MGILRILALLIFSAFLVGCAAHVPMREAQDNVPTTTASLLETQDGDGVPTTTVQSDLSRTTGVISEAKKPKPSAPKSAATASKTLHKDTINSTAADVGSPQKWEKEHAEDERKEQHLKQVIEGICRGC
jgi:hypothetical protein